MSTGSQTGEGKGVKTINVTEKTGPLVGMLDVTEKEDLMITCKSGVTIRTGIVDIREAGRATQGVKLIRLDNNDEIAAITKLDEVEDLVAEAEVGQENGLPVKVDISNGIPHPDDILPETDGLEDGLPENTDN
jgi:DNA gyrase subunit A